MATSALSPDDLSQLSSSFGGHLLTPDDEGFDDARRVHNGLIDRRPLLIARCQSTGDVVEAVRFARDHDLEVGVRGGGHNVAGRATLDDGLLIDLSEMKIITVDPKERTATVEPGVTWGELNRATQAHGLAVTGGVVSSTGVAGLTLGGGLGWLMGACGMTCDNLIEAEMVTADGAVVTASESANPDLLWGLRGGGGNLGIVTSFRFRLHPVGPIVQGGLVVHPFGEAKRVLEFYREVTAKAPDELTVFAGLLHAPDGSGAKVAAIVACHAGDPELGAEALRPLKEFGSPLMDALGPIEYSEMNTLMDEAYPRGALNYWKSSFLEALSDDAIDSVIETFSGCRWPMSAILLEHFHGAATRPAATDTAFPHREEGYNLAVLAEWTDPAETEAVTAWARLSFDALGPYFASRRYVNYLDDDEPKDAVVQAYGPNYARLQTLKTVYDPTNFFHLNQNVRPIPRA